MTTEHEDKAARLRIERVLHLNVGHGRVGLAKPVSLFDQLPLPKHQLRVLLEEPAQLLVVVDKLIALL